jgi:hypothetical protein
MRTLSLLSFEAHPLPSFARVMEDVAPLTQLIFRSLEIGAEGCRKYYDEQCGGEPPSSHLREMIVRDQAKRHLIGSGLLVKEERFRMPSEPLISLLILVNGYAIRVLKGKGGIIPGCGLSARRRKFYNQVPMRYLDSDGKVKGTHTNLILLWDFNPAFGIQAVWLACPQVAGARSQDVVLAWKEPIQNPVVETAASAADSETHEDVDHELEALLTGESEKVDADERLPLVVGQSGPGIKQGILNLKLEFEEEDGDNGQPNQTSA